MTGQTARQDLLAAAQRAGAPASAHLQVTARCHCTCVHCYQVRSAEGELTFAEIARVLAELADAGALLLGITGGEPFVRDDADAIVAEARRRGFAVKLLTTGHFLDDERCRRLRDLGAISVDLSV